MHGNRYYKCKECTKTGFTFISLNHPPIEVESTALFKCPAEDTNNSCDAENLTFKEFFLGSCCSIAAKWSDSINDSNERIKLIENYYEECREELTKMTIVVKREEEEVKAAEEVLEHAQSHLFYCKQDLNDSINNFQKSKETQNEIRERKKKAKARLDFLRGSVPSVKTEIDRNSCPMCFKMYAECQESAIPCGHRFCLSCLMELQDKICPTCQNPFTVEQIYKLI